MPEPDTEELEKLARNPSALGPKTIELLAEQIPPSRVITMLEEMMEATMSTTAAAKVAKEKGESAPPDWRAREAAAKLYFAYVVGMPVQRQHLVKETITPPSDPSKDISGSPAAMAALARLLAQTPEGRAVMQQELATIPA